MDHCIGQVVGTLKELGVYDSTLIVITSDHGERLGHEVRRRPDLWQAYLDREDKD